MMFDMEKIMVSMPSIGLKPFLLVYNGYDNSEYYYVSMPSIGLKPFLQKKITMIKLPRFGVNALNRAQAISTMTLGVKSTILQKMCQCPQSGSSHFYLIF